MRLTPAPPGDLLALALGEFRKGFGQRACGLIAAAFAFRGAYLVTPAALFGEDAAQQHRSKVPERVERVSELVGEDRAHQRPLPGRENERLGTIVRHGEIPCFEAFRRAE